MEKLAVVEDQELVKTASTRPNKCPSCGTPLGRDNETNVLKCPRCGTKPFEPKP